MAATNDQILINVTVTIETTTLQTIVENAKKIAGADARGIYHVDTAEKVNALVSAFLAKYNFDEYVNDLDNY